MNSYLRCALAIIIVSIVAGLLGSIVQTQVNLSALAEMGEPVSVLVRIQVTLEDLARFGIVMIAIAMGALTPALLLANLLSRFLSVRWSPWLMSAAGFVGFWVCFWVMSFVTPMPNLIVATEDIPGRVGMCMVGLVGGLLYLRLSRSHISQHRFFWVACAIVSVGVFSALTFWILAPKADGKISEPNTSKYLVQSVVTGLSHPWSLAFLPDGRALVTERAGRLLSIENSGLIKYISIEGLSDLYVDRSPGRFMDVLVDPEFSSNNYVYLTMVYEKNGMMGTRLLRARLVQDGLTDFRTLFNGSLKGNDGNNGGALAFLPDRTILVTVGDGELRREAQNPLSSFGKIIRVSADVGMSPDAPEPGQLDNLRAIFSMGHRNPQGIAVTRSTNEVLAVEHGPRGGDELNLIVAGANYGWPVVSAGVDYSFARISPLASSHRYQAPLLEWTPSIAPSRIAVYEEDLFREWRNDIFVATLKDKSVRRITRKDGRVVNEEVLLKSLGERFRDIKVGRDGAIYILTDGENAKLLRVVPALME